MAKRPTALARTAQTPLLSRSQLEQESLALIERTLGGRPGLVAALTHAPKSRDLDYLLGLIGDPAHAKVPLGVLCQQGGITPGELLDAWRQGEILRGHVLATKQVVEALPKVVADVVEKAAPYEATCHGCQGTGTVVPEPTKKRPNPEPETCPACQGGGRLTYPADLDRAKIVLDLAQLTPKGGPGVLIDQRQINLRGGEGGAAGGTLEALMAASDQILYGGVASPIPPPTAEPAGDPSEVVDAESVSAQETPDAPEAP